MCARYADNDIITVVQQKHTTVYIYVRYMHYMTTFLQIAYLQASVGVALVQLPGVVEGSPGEEREEQVSSHEVLVLQWQYLRASHVSSKTDC